ncbi:META domain-containing protein [Croceiramulus getboli]|nr:META domain-containing protein [Flavobacteriaceae bacterium YJPT1-3]
MKVLISSILLLLFAAKGCNDRSITPETMDGVYTLASFESKSMTDQDLSLTINSENKTLGGSVGCNSFTSDYTLDGNQVSFSAPLSTKMYCPETSKREREFFDMLTTVTRVEAEEDQLKFFNAQEETCFTLQKKQSSEN